MLICKIYTMYLQEKALRQIRAQSGSRVLRIDARKAAKKEDRKMTGTDECAGPKLQSQVSQLAGTIEEIGNFVGEFKNQLAGVLTPEVITDKDKDILLTEAVSPLVHQLIDMNSKAIEFRNRMKAILNRLEV